KPEFRMTGSEFFWSGVVVNPVIKQMNDLEKRSRGKMVALDDRLKVSDQVTQLNLPILTYSSINIFDRAFHTLLRKAEKPFDYEFASAMEYVSTSLCREISGAQFAYTQSDEVSVLVTDFDSIQTQSWFGGNLQKFVSISASIATKAFV